MSLLDLSFLRDLLNPRGLMGDLPTGGAEAYRRTYRFVCTLMGLLVPAFWVLYQWSNPSGFDPLWLRLLVAALLFAPVPLSQVSRFVSTHLRTFVQGALYAIVVYLVVLAVANRFTPNYALGLLFTATAGGIAFSLTVRQMAPLVRYLCFMGVAASGAAFTVPFYETAPITPTVFTVCMFSSMLVVLLGTQLRLYALTHSMENEKRYRRLMDAANDAILVADPQADAFVDANGKALELTGYSLEEIRRMSYADLHPAEDFDTQRAAFCEIYRDSGTETKDEPGSDQVVRDVQIVHRDGHRVPVDATATLVDTGAQRLVLGIFRDATQRRHHEQQLVAAKEHAEEMLRLKTDILNNMSHELRTPLTSILGFSEALSGELSDEPQEFAQIIQRSAERLQHTLNSVLDMAQLEHGDVTLQTSPVTLADEVEAALPLLRPLAEEQGLDLHADLAAPGAQAALDDAALHRILQNLAGNAIKFTEQGSVTLAVEADAAHVHLRVADTGVGISADFLPHLFEEFRQQSRGVGRHFEGNGLGLAITQRLVELMDGTIDVESAEGEGTTFTVSFPRLHDTPCENREACHASSPDGAVNVTT